MRRATPDFNLNVVPQKDNAPDTSSETRKMGGFKDISEVASAAPSSVSSADVATPKTTTPSRGKRQTEAQKKEEQRNKAVEDALDKVGGEMMKELAALPYEAWAFFFSDPALKLNDKEVETLSNTYLTIAKALKPEEVSSWRVLLALAFLQNVRIVMVKLRAHNENVERQKKIDSAMQDGHTIDARQVTLV